MLCPFCGDEQYPQHPEESCPLDRPDEVVIAFDSGRSYIVPGIVDHLVFAHEYQPPTALVGDVMNAQVVPPSSVRGGGSVRLTVGKGYPYGSVPAAFPFRLRTLLLASLDPKESPCR